MFYKRAFVLEGITLAQLIQLVVQMLVDLPTRSIFD